MAVTTTKTSLDPSDQNSRAVDDRNRFATGYLGGLPGADPNNPWGSGGNYFAKQMDWGASPVAKFFADTMGRIQAPKIGYSPQGHTYSPVNASEGDMWSSMLKVDDIPVSGGDLTGRTVSGVPVARTTSDAAIAAAKGIMEQVITPGVRAQIASSGLGRTGAEAEITSQRGAEMALPIASQWQAEQARANETEAQLAQSAANLTGQLGQSADNLKAQLGQSAANLKAQLQSQMQQVQFLEHSKSLLQSQILQARDDSEVRTIKAQLATVEAQLDVQTQQLMAMFAGKGLDTATAWRGQDQNFVNNLLRGIPLPGGETRTTVTDSPGPNIGNQLLNWGAIAAMQGGPALLNWLKSKGINVDSPSGSPWNISGTGPGGLGAPEDPGVPDNPPLDFNPNIGDFPPEVPDIGISNPFTDIGDLDFDPSSVF